MLLYLCPLFYLITFLPVLPRACPFYQRRCAKARSYSQVTELSQYENELFSIYPKSLPSSYTNFAFWAGQVVSFVFSDAVTWKIIKCYCQVECKFISSITQPSPTVNSPSATVMDGLNDVVQIQGKRQGHQIQERITLCKLKMLLR